MSSPNLKMLETVARALGSFTQEVVFVGGATVSLYLQNPASPEVRPTDDVDCFIELSSYSSYAEIEERMRKLGFEHDMSKGAPICRWLVGDIKVDVMPTDGAILGFTNRWYQSGVAHKISFLLPDGQSIFILSGPFFVATKLEAFLSRGHDDYRFSSDLEDIITVIDGRETLLAEVQAAPADLIAYLARHFGSFSRSATFPRYWRDSFRRHGKERADRSGYWPSWNALRSCDGNPANNRRKRKNTYRLDSNYRRYGQENIEISILVSNFR